MDGVFKEHAKKIKVSWFYKKNNTIDVRYSNKCKMI